MSTHNMIINKFQKYFKNMGSYNNERYNKLVYHIAEINNLVPVIGEIKTIIKTLINNRSPEEDNTISELL